MKKNHRAGRKVYIVDGLRTPFIKARSEPGPFSASDLALAALKPLMLRQSFAPTEFGEVIVGCAMPASTEANIARVISLRLGCGKKVPAWTVMRNCASGMQALDSAAQSIAFGFYDLVLAGGVDAMSHAPLLFPASMSKWLGRFMSAKTPMQKIKTLMQLRPAQFKPVVGLEQGLTDHTVGLSMGQTAENVAYRFHITRTEMDEFASRSHQLVAKTQSENGFTEMTQAYGSNGKLYATDDGVREDSSVEKLAKLKPYFDKPFGMVTAGNSSQITDGAAFLILASEDAVKKYNLPILGCIVDCAWAGCDPTEMGLGPVFATEQLLRQQKLSLDDIDYWEMNEAFAAQVLGCLRAFADKDFCKTNFGMKQALGSIAMDKFNIKGGAIAMGHPIGASGARIVLQLLNILKEKNAKRGIANICIGGGQGGAMLIERTEQIMSEEA